MHSHSYARFFPRSSVLCLPAILEVSILRARVLSVKTMPRASYKNHPLEVAKSM